MLTKIVYDFATNTNTTVNYDRACLIFKPTGLCTAIIDIDEGTTYTPPNQYYYILDLEGQVGWTWLGLQWKKPTDILINAYLEGEPTTDTPEDINDESLRVPNTFWVGQKIQDYVQNAFLPNLVLDGGAFTDAAVSVTYDAGNFDNTGSNLNASLEATLFDNTSGNLSSNIDASTF